MNEHIDSLIARRLGGECSPAEEAELRNWIAEAPENAAYYQEMEAAWHAMDEVIGGPTFNTSAAWEQVAPRLHAAPAASQNGTPKAKTVHLSNWIKYATAAAAVLIIAVLFLQPDPKEIHVLASNGNQEVRLPDNSVIRLRKGSSIRYPAQFSATERRIHLDGEAFFDVSKREDQRFVVDAGSVAVTVLATSFNVKTDDRLVDVSVATGRVQLLAKDYGGKKMLLRAGRSAHFEQGVFVESAAVSSDTAWLNRERVYTTTPLREIIADLSRDADTPITIDPSLSAALLDGPVQIRFKTEAPLRTRLQQLDLVAGTESVWQGKAYIIRMRR